MMMTMAKAAAMGIQIVKDPEAAQGQCLIHKQVPSPDRRENCWGSLTPCPSCGTPACDGAYGIPAVCDWCWVRAHPEVAAYLGEFGVA